MLKSIKTLGALITLPLCLFAQALLADGPHCRLLFGDEKWAVRHQPLTLKAPALPREFNPKILVIEPTAWDLRELDYSGVAEQSELIFMGKSAFSMASYYSGVFGRLKPWLDKTVQKLEQKEIDGIIGVQDFPASLIASALGERLGLRVPKLEVMLSLHNKFLSRQIQNRAAPEAVPDFALVDITNVDIKNPPLPYPFFLKPVKGLSSIKAQKIKGPDDLKKAIQLNWREKTLSNVVARPMDQLADLLPEGARVSNRFFIAESLLDGVQVTVDGFAQNGQVQILGVVDSIMYPGTASFESFQYPSRLPVSVQQRMSDIAKRVMQEAGFDSSLFNVEMFYDAKTDQIAIIEINPRMAYQFADLYEKVDGFNLYSLQRDIALGVPVQIPHRQGQYKVAGSFVPRVFPGQKVLREPTKEDLQKLQLSDPTIRIRHISREFLPSLGIFDDPSSRRLAFFNIGEDSFEGLRNRINSIYSEVGPLIQR